VRPFRRRLELEAHRLSRHLKARAHELRYLFWECTLRCNLRCGHCGSACGDSTQDPSPEVFLKVLDEVATRYVPSKVTVVITGGEPLLRSDLEACGCAIHERGFPWGMVTNGFFLDQRRLDSLLRSGLGAATVSLDGLEDSHNRLRRHPMAFAHATAAIAHCAAFPDLAFDVATCVHSGNLKELPELKRHLIGLGVRRWRLFSIFPRGRAKEDASLQLLPGQLRKMMEFLKSTRVEGEIRASYGCEGYLGEYEGQVRDGFFHCQAGTSVASVLSDGSISACPSLRGDFIQGNAAQDHFLEVWDQRYRAMRDRSWTRNREPCAHCPEWRFCEGNGLHLWDEGKRLLRCHLQELSRPE
jgi:radical SAM enzyme (rSAM/lipoprotein system)